MGPKGHQTGDKFEDLCLGLYVRVHCTNSDKVYVYTDPVIPVLRLTVESLQEFLNTDEEKAHAEWRTKFTTFLNTDPDASEVDKANDRTVLALLRTTCTPAPSKRRITLGIPV